ncbi:hypothetical protein ECG_06691 [Echinococcus granulosus]|nr:hypothetical protein ECG_06691 [Echinococcus granulosus]
MRFVDFNYEVDSTWTTQLFECNKVKISLPNPSAQIAFGACVSSNMESLIYQRTSQIIENKNLHAHSKYRTRIIVKSYKYKCVEVADG